MRPAAFASASNTLCPQALHMSTGYCLLFCCCPPSPSFLPCSQARLRDRHQELLRKKLFFLKQQQLTQEDPTGEGTSDDPPLFPSGHQEDDHGKEEKEEERVSSSKTSDGAGPSEGSGGGGADTLIDEDELLRGALEAYKSGGYSPRLVKHGDVDEVGKVWMRR